MAVLRISTVKLYFYWNRGFKLGIVNVTPEQYDVWFGLGLYWEKPWDRDPLDKKKIDIFYFFIDALDFDIPEGMNPRGLFEIIKHEEYTEKN